jgi:hypothetical protein
MNGPLTRQMAMLFLTVVLASTGVAAATISTASADGGGTATTTSTAPATTSTTPTSTSTAPTTTATTPTTTATTPTTTATTPTTTGTTTSTDPTTTTTTTPTTTTAPTTTPIIPAVVPPVLPGGFAQAVTTVTTVVVGAPITVAGTIATTTNNAVSNTTVINTTSITNLPPIVAGGLAAVPVAADICGNLPGSQPAVPAGHVLTLAKNGALVCVTPAIARILHPAAVAYQVPAGSRIVFPKKGGGLCIGSKRKSAKRVIVPAKTSAKKIMALANSGKLVCLGP